jgi:hypothetical protein
MRPLTTESHGYHFTYPGGDTIHVRLRGAGGVLDIMTIPEWVILNAIDQEAFRMLCLLWLYRRGAVAV